MRDLIKKLLKEYTEKLDEVGRPIKWNDDELRREAQKYNTRGEFQKMNPSAYNKSRKKNLDFFNNITSHMGGYKKWTLDDLKQEAQKYNTRGEFQKMNPSAYHTSLKKGFDFFDDITSHMGGYKRPKRITN